MKKVFFSAFALITFSISATANEIEEKKVEEKIIVKANCDSYAKSCIVAETYQYGPMSQSQFNEAYSFYYNTCVEANNSGATLLDPIFINP
jgi:hypothetical protein